MMENESLQTAVIVASNREGRFADTVADWFRGRSELREDMRFDVIDLGTLALPAALPAEADAATRAFRERIAAADAFVVITPEYNHSFPAPLKQAIDLAGRAWAAKPVGFVSYGGISGGLRAVEQLRQVFPEVRATTVRDTVSFHGAPDQFDDRGEPHNPEGVNAATTIMLDSLSWWARALKAARDADRAVTA